MFNVKDIKRDFPVLENRDVIYLDNAATTLTPEPVIESLNHYYRELGASVHRGIYQLADETTKEYEHSREKVAEFIGASSSREVVFTKNCTEGLNIIAYSLPLWPEKKGKILVTEMDHHSNILPWRFMARGSEKFELEYVDVTGKGKLDMENFRDKLSEDTVVVSFPAISNVTGTINPVNEITELAHEKNALVVVDGAQWLPHRPFDVKKYNVDFLTFSAHKMLGPTGLGVLYGKESLLRDMPPPFGGGEMVLDVSKYDVRWNEPPQKFEPGTPPIAQILGFASALEYIDNLGVSNICEHVDSLARRAVEQLSEISYVDIYGPLRGEPRGGLVSFNVEGVHPHDLATALDSLDNVAVRAGLHCAQPLHEVMGLNATARASFYVYNTPEEVDRFIGALSEAKKILGGDNER